MKKNPWDDPAYQRIENAKMVDGSLKIYFENGEMVQFNDIYRFIPPGYTDVRWLNLSFDPFEITVPAKPTRIIIPWDILRGTHPELQLLFNEHSKGQRIKMGKKLRQLREKKKISINDLHALSGILSQTIHRIENGKADVTITIIQKLLESMGYSLDDITE